MRSVPEQTPVVSLPMRPSRSAGSLGTVAYSGAVPGVVNRGLRWVKLDLHVHTPASLDYTGPRLSPKEFVDSVLAAGIHGIAVTDHNTAAWVDQLREASEATPLVVFPGVEITCNGGKGGIHIIALFDTDATSKHVEALLSTLKLKPDQYGRADAIVPGGPDLVVTEIRRCGGLPVLAHADSAKGVLHDMEGQQRIAVMNNPGLAAVELVNVAHAHYLDGTDPYYRRALAHYRASDNRRSDGAGHCVTGVGSRYSWFKVDGISLTTLGQCFDDAAVRIRSDVACPACPAVAHPHIQRLTVNRGFLGGLTFEFHDGLNSIVGGKGVGKSLLIEALRFVLGSESSISSIRDDAEGKLIEQVGFGAVVEATVQTAGGRTLTIRRTYDGNRNPTTATYDDGVQEKGAIAQLFPVVAYSQTEPLYIARQPSAQLALIDSFIELAPALSHIEWLRSQLADSDAAWADCVRAADSIDGVERDIATSTAKIAQIEHALRSPEHNVLAALVPKTQCLDDVKAAVQGVAEDTQGLALTVGRGDIPVMPAATTDSELLGLLAETRVALREIEDDAKALEAKVEAVRERVETACAAWQTVVEEKTVAYRRWAEAAGGDRHQQHAAKEELAKDRARMQRDLVRLKTRADKLETLRTERRKLLDALDAAAGDLYDLRAQTYSRLTTASGGRLNLSLTRHGRRSIYQERLRDLKRGSKLADATVSAIVVALLPREFVELVLARDSAAIATRAGINERTAATLIDFLLTREDLTELLACQHMPLVEDEPSITFRKEDGSYHELSKVSTGQQCTALLVIALSEGGRPVIMDQPEDALDTPSVYEDVTRQLRVRKTFRQFIVTTHNATVAVAGDSDEFHVLQASATQASIAELGAMDREPVRAAVIQHLEGGPEPYGLKIKKYRSPLA